MLPSCHARFTDWAEICLSPVVQPWHRKTHKCKMGRKFWVCIFETHPALWAFGATPCVPLWQQHRPYKVRQKQIVWEVKAGKKGDNILIPMLLLTITTRNFYPRRKFLLPSIHSERKIEAQESVPQGISVFCCLSPHNIFSASQWSDSSDFLLISK